MKKEIFERVRAFRTNPPKYGWDRIEALQEFSKVHIKSVFGVELKKRRRHFDVQVKSSKRMKECYERIRNCWACATRMDGLIIHHIVSLKDGGDSNLVNLVFLCNPCHKLIHEWIACNFRDSRFDCKVQESLKVYDTVHKVA